MSRSSPASAIGRISPNNLEGDQTLGGAADRTGPLGVKMNGLIALAVALAVRCDGCIVLNTAAAIRVGTTQKEIAEVHRIAAGHASAHIHATGVQRRLVRGGLAPWHMRRTKQILSENLDGKVTLADLAGECGLSISHFARAFKQTTEQSPHRWLLARRVEHAKRLLVTSALPLAEIAAACGFSPIRAISRACSPKSLGLDRVRGGGPGRSDPSGSLLRPHAQAGISKPN